MTEQNETEIKALIQRGESIVLEFKSDRKCLSDRDLIAALVSLTNTEGGDLLLGVEDDGTITGLHANHNDVKGLSALIANRTTPSLKASVIICETTEGNILQVKVPKSLHLTATSDGLLQRRRLKSDGTPESIPFYPHEFIQRQASMGVIDPSALIIEEISTEQLSSVERERIRESIRKYGGDSILLSLNDEEFDGALGLTMIKNGTRYPTMAGFLLLGREEHLRQYLPAHEVAFQVLAGTDVRVNEFFRKPLMQTFEEVEQLFKARLEEKEIQVGLFRVSIPNYERRAFREALVNALVHRDYARLGAVHVTLSNDGLGISSPGGFVEGVTLQNLLVTPPKPRNPLLADIMKRIGLAERSGRGIDRIFEGLLRYGRSAPDYTTSDSASVILNFPAGEADIPFLEMVLQQEENIGGEMPIDSLIVLSRLREERRLSVSDLMISTQKSEVITRSILEKLSEAGLLKPHGSGRGRTYTLSAKVYQYSGQKAAYIRQSGFDIIQQEQMIINFIDAYGSIKRADAMELCQITKDQASKLLKKLVVNGKISRHGSRRGTRYEHNA